jgi:hypothetical protein
MCEQVKEIKRGSTCHKKNPATTTTTQSSHSQLPSAATIAKEQLEQYILKAVGDAGDDALCEFYEWLLEQAKRHMIGIYGFTNEEFLS